MAGRSGVWALIVALLLPAAPALGEPLRGVALFAGAATHASTGVDLGDGGAQQAVNLSSSGAAFGLDYQWPFAATWSVNLFFISSSETFQGAAQADGSVHGAYGAELRYWWERWFMGAHVGRYSESLYFSENSVITVISGYGYGGGATLGYQFTDRAFVMVQADHALLNYAAGTAGVTGARLQVGYRWSD